MTKIFHLKKIKDVTNDKPYNEALKKLVNKAYNRDDLEIIDGSFFSFCVNEKKRLFFLIAKYQGENAIVVLEYNEEHDYKKSHIRQPGVLKGLLNQDIPDGNLRSNPSHFVFYQEIEPEGYSKQEKKQQFTLIPPYYHTRINVTLDEDQQQSLDTITMPMVITAPPGAGKSLVGMGLISKELAQPYDGQLPIWFITFSAYFCTRQKEQWQESHEKYGYPKGAVQFFFIAELLLKLKYITKQEELANEETFNAWFETRLTHYRRLQKKANSFVAASVFARKERIYEELLRRAGLDEEAYKNLGQRRSLFNKLKERGFINVIFAEYSQYLQSKNLVDPHLLIIKAHEPQARLIILDEGQDGSPAILALLFALVADRRLVINYGEGQSVNNALPLLDYYHEKIGKIVRFSKIHRCPPVIFELIKTYAGYKKKLSGGNISKLDREFELAPQQKKTGKLLFITEEKQLQELIKIHSNNASFFVLTHKEYLAQLDTQLPEEIMRTDIASFKGSEGSFIVLINLFKPAIYAKANAELQTASEPNEYRAREFNDAFERPMNLVISAVSRSTGTLVFYEEDGTDKRNRALFYQPIKEIIARQNPSTVVETPVVSSTTEWETQYQYFKAMGNNEEAQRVKKYRLDAPVVEEIIQTQPSAQQHRKTNKFFTPNKLDIRIVEQLIADVSVANYKALLNSQEAASLLLRKIVVPHKKPFYLQQELKSKEFSCAIARDREIKLRVTQLLLEALDAPRIDTEEGLFFSIIQTELLAHCLFKLILKKPEVSEKIRFNDLIESKGPTSPFEQIERHRFNSEGVMLLNVILQNNPVLKKELIKTEQFKRLATECPVFLRYNVAVLKRPIEEYLPQTAQFNQTLLGTIILHEHEGQARLHSKKAQPYTITTIVDTSIDEYVPLIKQIIEEGSITAFKKLLAAPNAAYIFFECRLTQYMEYNDPPFFTSLFIYLMSDRSQDMVSNALTEQRFAALFEAIVIAILKKQFKNSGNEILKNTFPYLFAIFCMKNTIRKILEKILSENPELQVLFPAKLFCKNFKVSEVFLNAPFIITVCAFTWTVITANSQFKLINWYRKNDLDKLKESITELPVTHFIMPVFKNLDTTALHILLEEKNYATGQCFEIIELLFENHRLLPQVINEKLFITPPKWHPQAKKYAFPSILDGLKKGGEKSKKALTILGNNNPALLPYINGTRNVTKVSATPNQQSSVAKSAASLQTATSDASRYFITNTKYSALVKRVTEPGSSTKPGDYKKIIEHKKAHEILFEVEIKQNYRGTTRSTSLVFILCILDTHRPQMSTVLSSGASPDKFKKAIVTILKKYSNVEQSSAVLKQTYPYLITLFNFSPLIGILHTILDRQPEFAHALDFNHLFNLIDFTKVNIGVPEKFWLLLQLLLSEEGVKLLIKLRELRQKDFDAYITPDLLCKEVIIRLSPLQCLCSRTDTTALLLGILSAKNTETFIPTIPFKHLASWYESDKNPTVFHNLVEQGPDGIEVFKLFINYHPKAAKLNIEFLTKTPCNGISLLDSFDKLGTVGLELLRLIYTKSNTIQEELESQNKSLMTSIGMFANKKDTLEGELEKVIKGFPSQ